MHHYPREHGAAGEMSLGTNELVGTEPERLRRAALRGFDERSKRGALPPRWDGRAGERIAAVLRSRADGQFRAIHHR